MTCVLKPANSAVSLYVPGRRLGIVYVPDSLVITVVATPVCVLVAVTVTPGINA